MNQEVLLSTGMADLREIEEALNILKFSGTPLEKITVLQCNTEYPTPLQDANIMAMKTIAEAFPEVRVGYSDHTVGIEVTIAAVALGATVIEKHFTLDKKLPGPDQCASIEADELKQMVIAIRNTELALGNGIKQTSSSEHKNKSIARKSIVALKKIEKGEMLSEQNLTVKRPGTGISPMEWDNVIGRYATKDYKCDELIYL
jgi:N,N'-diacetyllegionaminate synthase